jgi:hypothetical protein
LANGQYITLAESLVRDELAFGEPIPGTVRERVAAPRLILQGLQVESGGVRQVVAVVIPDQKGPHGMAADATEMMHHDFHKGDFVSPRFAAFPTGNRKLARRRVQECFCFFLWHDEFFLPNYM